MSSRIQTNYQHKLVVVYPWYSQSVCNKECTPNSCLEHQSSFLWYWCVWVIRGHIQPSLGWQRNLTQCIECDLKHCCLIFNHGTTHKNSGILGIENFMILSVGSYTYFWKDSQINDNFFGSKI